VLVGLPQGVGGLAILFLFYFILFILLYFSLFSKHAPGACRAAPKGLVALLFCFYFVL
jgi:hypothetical protein